VQRRAVCEPLLPSANRKNAETLQASWLLQNVFAPDAENLWLTAADVASSRSRPAGSFLEWWRRFETEPDVDRIFSADIFLDSTGRSECNQTQASAASAMTISSQKNRLFDLSVAAAADICSGTARAD